MFTVEERDRVRAHVLALAHDDSRVVAGAVVGGMVEGGGDRWSDLDLTFGLADGVAASDVLADWTADLERAFGAAHLFDLPFLSSVYRVLLLPGALQVDLSFTPGAEFGALGPRFELLFGTAVERVPVPRPPVAHLFGLAAHHAVRARFCIERGRLWQAEHWIAHLRDLALTLACRRRGLEADNGRGYDALPPEVLERAASALVPAVDRAALLRGLAEAVELLLSESGGSAVDRELRALTEHGWAV